MIQGREPFQEGQFKGVAIPEEIASPITLAPSFFAVGEMHAVLRGEIAAAHAYLKITEKMRLHRAGGAPSLLQDIHEEHLQSVAFWKTQLREEGEVAEDEAGAWGWMVDALVDTAGWLGDKAAYSILKKGEELALRRYEMLLQQECLTLAQEDHVRLVCIPRQQSHIYALGLAE
jgi:hypothetical protein